MNAWTMTLWSSLLTTNTKGVVCLYTIIRKNQKISDSNKYILYAFDKLDNQKTVSKIVFNLNQKHINVKRISVREISDWEEGTSIFSYKTIEEYLSKFGSLFTDNSIDVVNICCNYEEIEFIICVDAHMSIAQIDIFDFNRLENEPPWDEIMSIAE